MRIAARYSQPAWVAIALKSRAKRLGATGWVYWLSVVRGLRCALPLPLRRKVLRA